mgnify:FL=1
MGYVHNLAEWMMSASLRGSSGLDCSKMELPRGTYVGLGSVIVGPSPNRSGLPVGRSAHPREKSTPPTLYNM